MDDNFVETNIFLNTLHSIETNLNVTIAGGRTVRRVFEFGRTYVVRPKGRHQATVVWLHGLGDNGSRYNSISLLISLILKMFYPVLV